MVSDEKGTSLVVVNSKKGQELMDRIKDSMICEEVEFEKAISGNPSFNTTSKANPNSNKFFSELDEGQDFEKLVLKYAPKPSIIRKCINKAKRCIKKIIKH